MLPFQSIHRSSRNPFESMTSVSPSHLAGIDGQGPAVEEGLPVGGVQLVQHHQQARRLHELEQVGHAVGAQECVRQADDMRIVLGLVGGAFLHERHLPRLIGKAALQARAEVDPVAAHRQLRSAGQHLGILIGAERVGRKPDAGEVRLAVGSPRRRRREVGLSIREPWHARGRVFQPLGRRRDGQRDDSDEGGPENG